MQEKNYSHSNTLTLIVLCILRLLTSGQHFGHFFWSAEESKYFLNSKFHSFVTIEENNNVEVKQEHTTGEVNAEYKSQALKFHEKIDASDTEDMVAFSRRKPFTVS